MTRQNKTVWTSASGRELLVRNNWEQNEKQKFQIPVAYLSREEIEELKQIIADIELEEECIIDAARLTPEKPGIVARIMGRDSGE